MKFLTTLLLLCSLSAYANFISVTDLASCKVGAEHTFYLSKEDCVEKEAGACAIFPSIGSCKYLTAVDNVVEDLSAPIYSGRNDVESCQKEIRYEDKEVEVTLEDGSKVMQMQSVSTSNLPICSTVLEAKVCSNVASQKYIDELFTQVYCTHFTGYGTKIEGKKLVEDAAAKATYQAGESAKLQLQNAMGQAVKAQDCGRSTMAYMLVRNAPKALTTTQVKQLVSTYSGVKGLLESGSLTTAKEEIQAVVADGVLVTEADKAALIAHIDSCKP